MELSEVFKYDPLSGFLYWNISNNRVKAGTRAGHLDGRYYRVGYTNSIEVAKELLDTFHTLHGFHSNHGRQPR
jgi:hypothetical protein